MTASFERVAVLGLGLLGGSVTLAARERGVARRVAGATRRRDVLDAALARGAIDEGGSYEEAVRTATPGHDEFWKFLGPYGWSRGYMGEDGKPAKPGLIPTLEESLENKTILIGTPEQVAEEVQFYIDLVGLDHLTLFPHLLGDSYDKANEQMTRFAEEVLPLLR